MRHIQTAKHTSTWDPVRGRPEDPGSARLRVLDRSFSGSAGGRYGDSKRSRYALLRLIITGLALILLMEGCAGLRTPRYPTPILLDREPQVALRYEYESLTITAPVKLMGPEPSAMRLGIYQRGRSAEALLERIFFPGEDLQMILPRKVLDSTALGNLAVLTPLGGKFKSLETLFSLPAGPELVLPPFIIREPPGVVKGWISNRADDSPIAGAQVSVSHREGILVTALSDSIGFIRLELEARQAEVEELHLTVSTGGRFATWSQLLELEPSQEIKLEIRLGPSGDWAGRGTPYRVVADFVPFREGPENGSPIQFFISSGDRIAVTRVAGDRVYGALEIAFNRGGRSAEFFGWVLSKYLETVP